MINNDLSNRFNAYIPEVLLTVAESTKPQILDYINASVVSVDFAYVTSSETADDVLSATLTQECRIACKIFAQNIIRFGHPCNEANAILNNYFPASLIDMLHVSYPDLIALAYLNAGHAAFIAAGLEGSISNVKPQ